MKMTDRGNVEEIRHHGHTRACQEIGFAEPVRMVGEKRSFLEAWQCLGEVHLRISTSDKDVVLARTHTKTKDTWRPGGAEPRRAPRAARTSRVVRSDDTEKLLAHPLHLHILVTFLHLPVQHH